MAATVVITCFHGTTGATTHNVDGTTIRYRTDDSTTDALDATAPITVPTSGTSYSWIKHHKFNCTVAPSNLLNNLKVYSTGSNTLGTGCDLLMKTSTTYTNPTAQASTALAGTASVFTYTSASPLAVSGSSSTTGTFGDYIQSQFSITSAAGAGNTGTAVITYSYDES